MLVHDWKKRIWENKKVSPFNTSGVMVKGKCSKPKWPISIPAFCLSAFMFFLDWKKRIGENKKKGVQHLPSWCSG